jgi:CubicO group peptidase (beta-lactamase class C family)
MKKLTFLILLVFICQAAFAQKIVTSPDGKTLTTEQVDRIVKKLMDTAQVTGMGVGIVNNGKPAYVKSYGYRNKPMDQLNDTATCFYAASLAKPLFAYIVMQLVDEHKFDLDKPLYQYLPKPLPEYENYKDLAGDDRLKLITGRMCLSPTGANLIRTITKSWRYFLHRVHGMLIRARAYSYCNWQLKQSPAKIWNSLRRKGFSSPWA